MLNPRIIPQTPPESVVLMGTTLHRQILHNDALRTLDKVSHPCGQNLWQPDWLLRNSVAKEMNQQTDALRFPSPTIFIVIHGQKIYEARDY